MINIQAGSIHNWAGTLASVSPFGKTAALTVAEGENRILLVQIAGQPLGTLSVTFDGVPLTKFVESPSTVTTRRHYIYYLINPPVGTYNLFYGVSSWYGAYVVASAEVFDGVDQTTPMVVARNAYNSTATSPISLALDVASTAEEAVLEIFTGYSASSTVITEGAGFSPVGVSLQANGRASLAQYKIGAETLYTFTWTGGTQQSVQTAVILKAAAGGGSLDATAPGATLTGTATLTPGSAAGGSGEVDATADGVTLTGTATLTPGTATGGASGSFVSSPMYSSGILQASVALDWTWYPGAIGAEPTAPLVHGAGTTATDGTLTASGLSAGSGFLLAETADGAIYYEAGTVV